MSLIAPLLALAVYRRNLLGPSIEIALYTNAFFDHFNQMFYLSLFTILSCSRDLVEKLGSNKKWKGYMQCNLLNAINMFLLITTILKC